MTSHTEQHPPAAGLQTDPAAGRRARHGARIAGVSAVALGLTLGIGAIAGATTSAGSTGTPPAGHAPHGALSFGGKAPAASGKVATIGTDTFTLTGFSGATTTVDVSSSTTYTDPGVTSATFADLKTGDLVAVVGTLSSGTVTATAVYLVGPGAFGGHRGPGGPGGFAGAGRAGGAVGRPTASGKVTSVGTDSFTITGPKSSVLTVDVSGSTTYSDPGVTSPSFSNVKVGEQVAVVGTKTSDTVAATKVLIGRAGGPGRSSGKRPSTSSGSHASHAKPAASVPFTAGKVKTVGTDSFTLTNAKGTVVTVDVSSSTKYSDPGVASASFSDVKVGEQVAVSGKDSSNTVTATSVFIGGAGGHGFGGHGGPGGPGGYGGGAGFGAGAPVASGTVKTVGTNTFTLTEYSGTVVTVNVTGTTAYTDFGTSSPTFADITVGARVTAIGADTSNTVTATRVVIGGFGGRGGPGHGGPGGFGPGGGPNTSSSAIRSAGTNGGGWWGGGSNGGGTTTG